MADYIKREDAINAFDPLQRQDWYTPWIVETLKDLPSADVVPMEWYKSMENTCVKLQKSLADVAPVRHGYWLPMVAENKMTKDIRGARACSECGASYFSYYDVPDIEDVVPNYCPNCGARMDGESNG